jgi:hypothetical protein
MWSGCPKMTTPAASSLTQIPASQFATRRKCMVAQTADRTKMFYVKHFCPIDRQNRTQFLGPAQ